MLSDAAKAAICSEKKIKNILSENIDQYYERIITEFKNNTYDILIKNKEIERDSQDDLFLKEIIEYDKYMECKKNKVNTEEARKHQLEDKKKTIETIQSMTANDKIIIIEPVEIKNTNDNNILDDSNMF